MNTNRLCVCACVMAMLGCQPDANTPDGNDGIDVHQGRVLRYLALGDSYTIGEAVTPSARWPNQLVDALRPGLQDGDSLAAAKIVATTGWTTADLKQGMDGAGLDTTAWDLVSLLIGVNNQFQGLPIEDYAQEFDELLDAAIGLAGGDKDARVCVEHSGLWVHALRTSQPTVHQHRPQAFNDTCRTRTSAKGVSHFNITDISQQWPDTPGLVAVDGLHPSGLQYSLWVDSFAGEVEDKLE